MPTADTDSPYDVFISYSHADQVWVRSWLAPRLKGAGFRVCVDYESFDIGVPALTNMERAVEQSSKTMLVLTPRWTESDWANFESLLAQTGDPIGRLRRMLPLMLEQCTPRRGISIHTYANFTNPEHWESELGRLVDAINDRYNLPPTIDVPRFTASARIPFLLPQLDVPTFSGRGEELTRLEELLLKQGGAKVCSIVGLAGAGGIGKSALACHFAELHREDFPDGIIGLRVDGKETATLAREFARHIGKEIDPEDERDAATIMQEVFAHRRMLLIYDNADDAGIAALSPGGGTCAVIVTTRDRQLPFLLSIPEEGRINLSPLPDADALLLLERLLGEGRVGGEPGASREIIGLVGGLPLALQIVGATLQLQEWRGLANYATSLRKEKERLSKLQIRGASNLNVRASISLSMKLLADDEVDFFACLSICAQDGFSVRAATAASGCEADAAHERLGQLFRLSLLNLHQSGTNRFVLHPLLRLFAQELAAERSLYEAAAERHASCYVGLVKSYDEDAVVRSLLTAELGDLILAAEWLHSHGPADKEFISGLDHFLHDNGYWQQGVELMGGFYRQAELASDFEATIRFRMKQAKFLSLRGEWNQALHILAPIPDALERVGPQHLRLNLEAKWLNILGGIQQRLGQFDEAARMLLRGAAIEEQLGDLPGLAKVLTSLGGVLQRQGRFDEAVDAFRCSIKIEEQLNNQRGQSMVLNSLGGVLQRQGRFDEAIEAFRSSYDLAVAQKDRRGQAMVLTAIGKALLARGETEEALADLREAFAIDESLRNSRGVSIVAPTLIRALIGLGSRAEALDYCKRALALDPGSQRLVTLCEELLAPPKSAGSTELIRGIVKRDLILHMQGYRYGFISPDDGSPDIYFRDTAVEEGLLADLKSGLRVEAEVRPGRKGREAKSIKAITQ